METTVGLAQRFVILINRANIILKKGTKNKKQMSKYTKALNKVKPGTVYNLLKEKISTAEIEYDKIDDVDNENNKSKRKVFKSLTSKIGPILKKLQEAELGESEKERPSSGLAKLLKRQAQQQAKQAQQAQQAEQQAQQQAQQAQQAQQQAQQAQQQTAPWSQKMQRSIPPQANVGSDLRQPLINTTYQGQPDDNERDDSESVCGCDSCPCPFGGRKKKTKRTSGVGRKIRKRTKIKKRTKRRRTKKRKTRKRRGGMRRGNYTQRSPIPRQVKKAFRNR